MIHDRVQVLHVIEGLGPGGAERSLSELLPLLSQRGVESRIACLSRRPAGVHRAVEQAGYPVQVLGRRRLPAMLAIRRILREWRPDIVHTTIFEADVLGRVAATAGQTRVLTSLVNTTYDGAREADARINPAKLATVRSIDGFTARHMTDHFHAISEAVRDSAVRNLGISPNRVTVVERGRDRARLGMPSPQRRRLARNELGLPQDAEVILNIGRQEPQKGQAILVEAIRILADARPGVVVLQAGRPGNATAQLTQACERSGLGSRVRFLGQRDDVGDLLAAADVFAFPSFYEGLGGSVLEAMAMKLPIVVTDVPALSEVVECGRGARIVPVGDAPALAQAIAELLKDGQAAAALGAEASRIFDERFTLERSADRMVALYRRVATGSQPR